MNKEEIGSNGAKIEWTEKRQIYPLTILFLAFFDFS
jgi:hypothetical protein